MGSKPASSGNGAPSGTWSGDYGPDADRRDPVTLDLRWEDSILRGTVRAGPRSLDVHNGSFKPETGAITLEFDAQNNGRTVHYMIDGKVNGNKMSGSWRTEAARTATFISRAMMKQNSQTFEKSEKNKPRIERI